jgi:hypothetical protein
MTVRIPIGADASQVVSAFDQISAAIQRSGQAGRALKDMDLSHPELKKLADDLKVVEQRMLDLARVGQGATAAAARKVVNGNGGGGLESVLAWQAEMGRRFPDAAQRNRVTGNAGRYIFGGTQFMPNEPAPPAAPPAPPPAPRAPPPGGGGGGGGSGGGGIGGGLAGLLGGPLKFMLEAAGLGSVLAIAGKAVSGAEKEDTDTDKLMRTIRGTADQFGDLRDSVRQTTVGLRLTYGEAQRLSLSWANLTNETSASKIQDNVRLSTGLARSYGLDPSATTGAMGRAAYLGEDPRRFALLIAEASRAGGQSGQVTEVMQALLHWSETASRVLVTHTNVAAFAAMYAGMNASGLPGLKGDNATALIGQINSSIMQGGSAGEAGKAFIYRALSAQGIKDPYEMMYAMQGGMFEHVGHGGMTVYDAVRARLSRQYPGGNREQNLRRWNAESNLFGINMHQAEPLDNFQPGDVGHANDMLSSMGINLTKLDPTAIGDIANVLAPNADLNAERKRLLARKGDNALAPAEAAALQGASGGGLREMMVRLLGAHGQEKTEGTKVTDSTTALSNAITAAGTGLIPVINDLRSSAGEMGKEIGKLSAWLEKKYPDAKDAAAAGDGVSAGDWDAQTGTSNLGDTSAPVISPGGIKPVTRPYSILDPTTWFSSGTGGTRAERNNNPGNLMYAGQSGAGRDSGGFAVFPNVADGTSAYVKQLQTYQRRDHLTSISQMILKASPRGPANPNVDAYIASVAKELGVDPNAPFDMNNAGNAERYVTAISRQEGHAFSGPQVHAGVARTFGVDPGGTQLPAGAPAGGAAGGGGVNHTVTVAPIRVVHQTSDGTYLATEHVPVTTGTTPKPWGGNAPSESQILTDSQAVVNGALAAKQAPRQKMTIAPSDGGV